MKIACIASSRIPSETANSIQAMKVCQALAQTGHEVTLIAPGDGPQGETNNDKWQVLADQYGLHTPFDFVHIPPFEGRFARRIFPWRAVLRAKQLGVDAVYTWLYQSAAAGLILGRLTIIEMHDLPPGRFGPLWYRLFLRISGQKRQLAITSALQMALSEQFSPQLAPGESLIAPNGVDLAQYADLPAPAEARAELGLPQMPTVATTGHLYAGRGAELFLELAPQMPDVHFLWVGGRPNDVDRWREKTAELGIKNVTFAGFIPNSRLPRYQAAADILLMPYGLRMGASSGENPVAFFNPMKMFDYMASSRPIITTDLPVIHEVLGDGSAVFIPAGNLVEWQAAIRDLLADPSRSAKLAAAARQDVEAYTWVARAEKSMEGLGS
ncbi:MAG: glycosyltransferase family 4 protein [Chloroflexota bacterium]